MWNAGIYKEGIENHLWSHYSLLLTWSFPPYGCIWDYFVIYTFHTVLYTTFSLNLLKKKPQSLNKQVKEMGTFKIPAALASLAQ